MTVYEEIGLPRVVNASGRVTVLGVSTISDKVAKAAVAGGQSYVVVEDLMDKAGEIISQYTGGEDSCPTVCASAAIALSVAGMISRGKKTIMDRLPDSTGLANEIILQKGHVINFNAPIETMLRLGGDEVWVGFLGRFNASNLLAVYGAALLLGADRSEVLTAMSCLRPVSGRLEFVRAADGRTAVVDYAHTPDALENVLRTLGELLTGGGQLIAVCGCGGDRDRTKRPEMAAMAVKYAATAIFTSDNPRHEDPESILDEMVAGLPPEARYLRIADRGEAIRAAAMLARPGDIVLLAGKGHETYQIVGDERRHFDDRQQIEHQFSIHR